MNRIGKLILGAICFVVLIGGAAWLYDTLSEDYTPQEMITTTMPATLSQAESETSFTESGTSQNMTKPSAPEKLKAIDFSVVDMDGDRVKLFDFEGKPVVVNFWASWCPPCKEEMPEFEKVWKELGEEVVFMMVNATDGFRETVEKAKTYISEKEYSFPVYFDEEQEAVYNYGIGSFPTTMFIDREGYVITGYIGMIDEATLRDGIALITDSEDEEP